MGVGVIARVVGYSTGAIMGSFVIAPLIGFAGVGAVGMYMYGRELSNILRARMSDYYIETKNDKYIREMYSEEKYFIKRENPEIDENECKIRAYLRLCERGVIE